MKSRPLSGFQILLIVISIALAPIGGAYTWFAIVLVVIAFALMIQSEFPKKARNVPKPAPIPIRLRVPNPPIASIAQSSTIPNTISSSDDFLSTLAARRKDKLLGWREKYAKSEYPLKVAKNLLYEGLAIQRIWPELLSSFTTIGNAGERLFSDLSSAQNHVFVRRRQISVNDILPTIEENYPRIKSIPTLDFTVFRTKVASACNGDPDMIEEVEFTYYYYCASYEMIYLWASFGLLGVTNEQASLNVSGAFFPGTNYSSPNDLVSNFAIMASHYYSPLPRYSS